MSLEYLAVALVSLTSATPFRMDSAHQTRQPAFEVIRQSGITAFSDCRTDEVGFSDARKPRSLLESRLKRWIQPHAFHA
jgi:hypothetical protein